MQPRVDERPFHGAVNCCSSFGARLRTEVPCNAPHESDDQIRSEPWTRYSSCASAPRSLRQVRDEVFFTRRYRLIGVPLADDAISATGVSWISASVHPSLGVLASVGVTVGAGTVEAPDGVGLVSESAMSGVRSPVEGAADPLATADTGRPRLLDAAVLEHDAHRVRTATSEPPSTMARRRQ